MFLEQRRRLGIGLRRSKNSVFSRLGADAVQKMRRDEPPQTEPDAPIRRFSLISEQANGQGRDKVVPQIRYILLVERQRRARESK